MDIRPNRVRLDKLEDSIISMARQPVLPGLSSAFDLRTELVAKQQKSKISFFVYTEPMFPTRALFAPGVRLTLFTRVGCSLCDTAKNNVLNVRKRRPFDYSEIDVMAPGNKVWKDVYEFDVPVLHVQTVEKRHAGAVEEISEPKKLFHRFTEQEVEKSIDEAEQ